MYSERRDSFLLELHWVHIPTHGIGRDIPADLCDPALGHKNEVTVPKTEIFVKVARVQHLLQVNDVGLGHVFRYPVKQDDLRMTGLRGKSARYRYRFVDR